MLLQDTPGAPFLVGLSTFVRLLFYVTSADPIEDGEGVGRIGRTATLVVPGELSDFRYPVQVRSMPAPSFGTRMIEGDDVTHAVEVALPTGGRYSLLDHNVDQVCHDVLDHYERWATSVVLTDSV